MNHLMAEQLAYLRLEEMRHEAAASRLSSQSDAVEHDRRGRQTRRLALAKLRQALGRR